jgi:hypothetical protein
MSDPEVRSKITVETQGAVDAIRAWRDNMAEASHGVAGNLDALSAVMSHFSLGTVVALGAVGVALSGLGRAFGFAMDAAAQVNDLSEKFEQLQEQTGASLKQLTLWDAAMKLGGGDVQQLAQWVTVSGRALKQNADMLVANGIAANKADLMQMGFVDRLKGVVAAAEKFEEPGRRQQFVTEALGRAAWMSWPQVKKFVEHLEEAGHVVGQNVTVTKEMIDAQNKSEIAVGKVDLAYQNMIISVGKAAKPLKAFWRDMKMGIFEFIEAWGKASESGVSILFHMDEKRKEGLRKIVEDYQAWQKKFDEDRAKPKTEEAPAKKLKTKEEIEQERALHVQAATDKAKLAEISSQQQQRIAAELLERKKIDIKEELDFKLAALKEAHDAAIKAANAEAGAAGTDQAKAAAAHGKKKELTAKYWDDIDRMKSDAQKRMDMEELSNRKKLLDQELALFNWDQDKRISLLTEYYEWLETKELATLQQISDAQHALTMELKKESETRARLAAASNQAEIDVDNQRAASRRAALEAEMEWGMLNDAQVKERKLALLATEEEIAIREAQVKRDANMDKAAAEIEYQQSVNRITNEFALQRRQAQEQEWAFLRSGWASMMSGFQSGLSSLLQKLTTGMMTWGHRVAGTCRAM